MLVQENFGACTSGSYWYITTEDKIWLRLWNWNGFVKKIIVHWYLINFVMFLPLFIVFCFLLCFSYSYVLPVETLQDFGSVRSLHGLTGDRAILGKRKVLKVTEYTEINPGSGHLWAANGQRLEKHSELLAVVGEGVLGNTGLTQGQLFLCWRRLVNYLSHYLF